MPFKISVGYILQQYDIRAKGARGQPRGVFCVFFPRELRPVSGKSHVQGSAVQPLWCQAQHIGNNNRPATGYTYLSLSLLLLASPLPTLALFFLSSSLSTGPSLLLSPLRSFLRSQSTTPPRGARAPHLFLQESLPRRPEDNQRNPPQRLLRYLILVAGDRDRIRDRERVRDMVRDRIGVEGSRVILR